MRTLYREKIYKCGKYLEVNIYPVYKKPTWRSRKSKPTKEIQKKLNDINAENNLIRICNANFNESDYKVELTYDNAHLPCDDETAAKILRNFLRRLKRFRKKNGLPELKYIAVTERGILKGRYHHHLIINGGFAPKEIYSIWGMGYVHTDPLQFSSNGIADLARYMVKKSVASSKKWNGSKNLIHPAARTRDGRLSKRKVVELAIDTGNSRQYEKYYDGYYFAEARRIFNDVNGGVYIQARFYKKEDKKCNTYRKRPKA